MLSCVNLISAAIIEYLCQTKMLINIIKQCVGSGGSKGVRPPRLNIFSISCSFSENLAKSYFGAPSGGLASPATGNSGSTPGWQMNENFDV